MFSRIAPRYDLTNSIISAGLDRLWRQRLAARITDQAPTSILDVACGTAGVLLQIARRCPPTTRLVGVDFTETMLRVGRMRLMAGAPAHRTLLCVGDAQQLPYPNASVEAVSMMFGVRNFADPVAALAECYRVLRADGWLCLVEFSWPRQRALQLLYQGYLRYLLPCLAWPLCGDRTAYRYLGDSVLAFRPRSDLTPLLQRTGFRDIDAEPLSGGITTLYYARKTPS